MGQWSLKTYGARRLLTETKPFLFHQCIIILVLFAPTLEEKHSLNGAT